MTNSKANLSQPPKGFEVVSAGAGLLEIRYRRSGMRAMNIFLFLWLSIWTVACGFLLQAYLNGATMDDGSPMPLWFVAVFWAAEILVLCVLLYTLFIRKLLRVDYQALTVEFSLLGMRWQKSMRLEEIIELQQIKDGGGRKDSFPSWGLRLTGEVDGDTATIMLISRQPHSRSLWLGQVLAEELNKPFQPA